MITGFGVDCFVTFGEVAVSDEVCVIIDVVLYPFACVALVSHSILYYNYNSELNSQKYKY